MTTGQGHPLPHTLVNVSISSTLGAFIPRESLAEGQGSRWAQVSSPWHVPVPPLDTHVVPCRAARKCRWAKASMGQAPMTSPMTPSPSGPSANVALAGDTCGAGQWAPGTASTGGQPQARTHLGFPVQLLGSGSRGHSHSHGRRSCHLALLVPGLLFPLRRQMDKVRRRNGLDVLGREEP